MKKFLSLVLALVMTMSLVTVSAGAKDFTDNSKITYDEAVAVMSAAKVIDGYADGSFNPTNTLTRGAAAKIICNLILGPTTAEALVADAAPYKDVPANHTFAGYIAYCQKEGIISGYADGTFRPANTLTGYAFMKMLLGALGYDAATENYTGSNWSINVAKRALNIGLDDDLVGDFNGVKAVTREEACLYAFNTLKATMVEYDNNNSVTVNGVTFTNKSAAKEMVNNAKVETIKEDNKMQFAEKYFDKLSVSTKASDKVDSFGRPATTWIYDKDTVGTYADKADETLVIADGGKTLATIITGTDYLDYDKSDVTDSTKVWVNGDDSTYKAAKAAMTSKGAIVETYENDDGVITDIVIRVYTYAKIDEIDNSLSTAFTKKGATTSITLKDLNDNGIGSVYYNAYDNRDDLVLAGFDAKTYDEDTVLAIVLKNSDKTVLESYVAEKVSGVPTAGRAVEKDESDTYVENGSATIAGTKYNYAGSMTGLTAGQNVNFDDSFDLYLTKEGYVIAVDGSAAISLDDLYYVTGIYKVNEKGSTVYYAQAISLVDGKVSEMKLEDKHNDFNVTNADAFGKFVSDGVKGIYVMKDEKVLNDDGKTTDCKADNGKYNATAYVGQDKYTVIADTLGDKVNADAFKITYDGTKQTVNGTTPTKAVAKSYITKDTSFIAAEGKSDDLTVKTATGGMKMAQKDPSKVYVLVEDGKTDAVVVLYVGDDLGSVVDTTDVVYLKDDTNTKNANGYEGTLYFMKDMSSQSVTIKEDTDKGFYVYGVDDKDVYKLSAATELKAGDDTSDDGTTGYAMGVKLTGSKSQKVTGTNDGATFSDVDYSKATIIDTRSQSDRDASVYTGTITSASALESAIKKSSPTGKDFVVTANVYVDKGEITFIDVTSVEAAAEAPNGGKDNGNEVNLTVKVEGVNVTVTYKTTVPTSTQVRNAVVEELDLTWDTTRGDRLAIKDNGGYTMTIDGVEYNVTVSAAK